MNRNDIQWNNGRNYIGKIVSGAVMLTTGCAPYLVGQESWSLSDHLSSEDIVLDTTPRNSPIRVSDLFDLSKSILLDSLLKLRVDQDYSNFGFPEISETAYNHCNESLSYISNSVSHAIRLSINEWGGVKLKVVGMQKDVLSCDFGDTSMSFYVLRQNSAPEFYSFIEYNENNYKLLAELISAIV